MSPSLPCPPAPADKHDPLAQLPEGLNMRSDMLRKLGASLNGMEIPQPGFPWSKARMLQKAGAITITPIGNDKAKAMLIDRGCTMLRNAGYPA